MFKHLLNITSLIFILSSSLFAQEKNISTGSVFEGEPFLAVNPNNYRHLVIAWMGFVPGNALRLSIKTKVSFDAGTTWSNSVTQPHIASSFQSADPSIVFDKNNNVFLCYIDYKQPDSGGVYITKSKNGGLVWGSPIKIISANGDGTKIPLDRPWLTINNEGNKLFVTTKPAPWVLPPNRPYFIGSIDSGVTWSALRYLDTTNFLVGNLIAGPMASPCVSGNTFYAVYPSYLASQNINSRYIIASTNNNGISFNYKEVVIASSCTAAITNDSAKNGYRLVGNPKDTNHLAFIYFCGAANDADVYFTETKNAGTTWSTPKKINDDASGNGVIQDMVWADFDTDGDLAITWRDRRNASNKGFAAACEFFAAFRCADSLNFKPNMVISDSLVAYNTILSASGNDCMSSVLRNDTLYAAYGSTRDGSLDIWFKKVVATTGCVTSTALINSESNKLFVYPNPTHNKLYVQTLNNYTNASIQITTLTGQVVKKIKNVNTANLIVDVEDLPSNIYLLSIINKSEVLKMKFEIKK